MGTKTALKALNALTKVDWADPANSIKESVANTGIIGGYEGTPLMEIVFLSNYSVRQIHYLTFLNLQLVEHL